ncbi:Flp/Fap pilin component [compost metagenome]
MAENYNLGINAFLHLHSPKLSTTLSLPLAENLHGKELSTMSLMSLIKKFKKFSKEEEGASGIEYAIVAAMVAVAIITFSPGIKNGVSDTFEAISDSFVATP